MKNVIIVANGGGVIRSSVAHGQVQLTAVGSNPYQSALGATIHTFKQAVENEKKVGEVKIYTFGAVRNAIRSFDRCVREIKADGSFKSEELAKVALDHYLETRDRDVTEEESEMWSEYSKLAVKRHKVSVYKIPSRDEIAELQEKSEPKDGVLSFTQKKNLELIDLIQKAWDALPEYTAEEVDPESVPF